MCFPRKMGHGFSLCQLTAWRHNPHKGRASLSSQAACNPVILFLFPDIFGGVAPLGFTILTQQPVAGMLPLPNRHFRLPCLPKSTIAPFPVKQPRKLEPLILHGTEDEKMDRSVAYYVFL